MSSGGFLLLLLILGAIWVMFVLPARRKQRSHAEMQDSVTVGDEIITAGGLHAVVREMEDDRLRVELAPGTIVTLDRRAVAAVARDVEVEVEAAAPVAPDESADPSPKPS